MTREPFLKKPQLARELQVSTRTIERLDLPCVKVGNTNRYLLSEVMAHLRGEERRAEIIELRPRRGAAA